MIAEEPYLSLIGKCNCVVQFSCACEKYDKMEQGASTFLERVESARKIAQLGKRVNIRVQPYIPTFFNDIMQSLELFADAGVHGVIFEAMKFQTKKAGTIKIGADHCYPTKLLYAQFIKLKQKCHDLGMKFYSGENRLRQMGDSLCCCGVEDMGWKVNTCNLNHFLFDKEGVVVTEGMSAKGTASCFKGLHQDVCSWKARIKEASFKDEMEWHKQQRYAKFLLPDK